MAEKGSDKGTKNGTEDIVGRLEALRKRVPTDKIPGEDKKPQPDEGEPPVDEKRKKIARIVGVSIIVLVLLVGIVAVNKFVIQPKKEASQTDAALEQQRLQQLNQNMQQTLQIIKSLFSGLPSEYKKDEALALEEAANAGTQPQLQSIIDNSVITANAAWRLYRNDELTALAQQTDKIRMRVTIEQLVGNDTIQIAETYKGENKIRTVIDRLDYEMLKTADIEEVGITYVAIRLQRLQAGGGLVEIGKRVNVYFKQGGIEDGTLAGGTQSKMVALAKDAKVMASMRASASIDLTESETKLDSGAGAEGKETMDFTLDGIFGTIEGQGSVGYRERLTETTYSIDLLEIQKAAAASKLDEDYIENVLKQYGIKLGNIERESNLASFDEEYILLLEVTEEEAPDILLRMTDEAEMEDIYVALSEPTSWMTGI